jgi:hypothetical protein
VQRDRQRAVSELDGAIDELFRCMWNPIDGIVRRMTVKLDLQHIRLISIMPQANRSGANKHRAHAITLM